MEAVTRSNRHSLTLTGEIFSTVHKKMESIKQGAIESSFLLEQSLMEHCKYQTFLPPSQDACLNPVNADTAMCSILRE